MIACPFPLTRVSAHTGLVSPVFADLLVAENVQRFVSGPGHRPALIESDRQKLIILRAFSPCVGKGPALGYRVLVCNVNHARAVTVQVQVTDRVVVVWVQLLTCAQVSAKIDRSEPDWESTRVLDPEVVHSVCVVIESKMGTVLGHCLLRAITRKQRN